jgi:acetyl esterase/lipase
MNHHLFSLTITCCKRIGILFTAIILSAYCGYAQERITYKQADTTQLTMTVYKPGGWNSTKTYPALVFFFGGGWSTGNAQQFEPQARYFSQRGMVCFLVDYRVSSRQHTSPFESVKDARSAIRFVRSHAATFAIDTSKIAASGGSAGGHLAAAAAILNTYDESTDDLTVSCAPNALLLFNPVIDNGPGGYGYERIGEAYKNFSPLHNLHKGAPPTIIFLGTNDNLIPVQTAQYYKVVMEKLGSRCDLKLYEGQPHGFFNKNRIEYYRKTVKEADLFLQSIGYITTEPEVPIE